VKVGLVGYEGSGKTTVFNALTGLEARVGTYGTNVGVVKVPDVRVDALAKLYEPKKVTHAEVRFVDLPGAGRDAIEDKLLAQMRDQEALVLVLKGFESAVAGASDALAADLARFETELTLADLVQVEKRQHRLVKEGKGASLEATQMTRLKEHLEAERPLRSLGLGAVECEALSGFAFLTLKPLLTLVNVADDDAGAALPSGLAAMCAERGVPGLVLGGALEMELNRLAPEERVEFLADLGLKDTARDRFVALAYDALHLMSFLTVGPDEVRAWTIRKGTHALDAAGRIHSDIQRGFIRAETIRYEDLVAYGSEAECRKHGKARLEGKDYVMQDGDVVHFRFNV
jgi:hypothetical protein